MKPFNLELAKDGHSLLSGSNKYSYLAGPDPEGYVAVRSERGSIHIRHEDQLCMAPIGEVEGKPVYPGDTLYIAEDNATHAKVKRGDIFKPTEYGGPYLSNDEWSIHTKYLSWEKPKVKKTAWMNIYPDKIGGTVHTTKESADILAAITRIKCVEITWEE